jgi:hypothetical protein
MDTSPTPPEEQSRRKLSYVFLAIGSILFVITYFIGISDNPPGIASLLLGGFSFIVGIFYRFGKSRGRKSGQEFLYWAPRALCITFALFSSIFAFDVFGGDRNFWETALALIMQIIPTFLIVILLMLSWRWEWIGGYLFIVLAVLYIVWSWGKPFATWYNLLFMAGPLALTGALFLLNWYKRGVLRGSST